MRHPEVFVRELDPHEGQRLKRLSKRAKHAPTRQQQGGQQPRRISSNDEQRTDATAGARPNDDMFPVQRYERPR